MNLVFGLFYLLFASLAWAFGGHLLWLFYRFLWRNTLSLLGMKRKEAPVESGDPADSSLLGHVRGMLNEHGLKLLGIAGALLAAMAFFWLLDDLVADAFTQKVVQLSALILLTLALLLGGYRIRVARPDVLGTGLMLLGFCLIPIDAMFYEQEILGYSTRSSFQIALLLAGIATFLSLRTGSRTFTWIAPPCLMSGILLLGYKFRWPSSTTSYAAALLAGALLALALYVRDRGKADRFSSPLRLAAILSSVIALIAYCGSYSGTFPLQAIVVAIFGGGTLAVIAYLASDLRGLLLLLPYFGILFSQYFSRFSTSYGPIGVICSGLALALLLMETRVRRGTERRRGLEPWCSVPALFLLLLAFVADSLSIPILLERAEGLARIRFDYWTLDHMAYSWSEIQRGIFYLARLEDTLFWATLSGLLTAIGIAYVGNEARIPLFAYAGGIPGTLGVACGLLWLRPFELHGESYVFYLLAVASLAFVMAVCFNLLGNRAASRPIGVVAHLLTPAIWLTLGYRLYPDSSVPAWFTILTAVVIGSQLLIHHRVQALPSVLVRMGKLMMTLPWFVAILSLPRYGARDIQPLLVLGGFGFNGVALWWGLARQRMADTALGAVGLTLTLVATIGSVLSGEIYAKVIVLLIGLGLLWAGARTRGKTTVVILALASSTLACSLSGVERITTKKSLETLARLNPEDPLIQVLIKATGFRVPPRESTTKVWKNVVGRLSSLTGVDSAAAAMQLISTPWRLKVNSRQYPTISITALRAADVRPLNYAALARRLPGKPGLPATAGDILDQMPSDRIQLRFTSPESLKRLLQLYDSQARALLAVTAPGLDIPGPDGAFRQALDLSLSDAAGEAAEGVILIGDPYLHLAPDIVLVLRFEKEEKARERAGEWSRRFGQHRAARVDRITLLSTTGEAAQEVYRCLKGLGDHVLSKSPDFRYASLLNLPAPDGRLFISEDTVQRLISPAFRLAVHRRDDCLVALAELEAARFFGKQTRRVLPEEASQARKAAISKKWISRSIPCRSGGSTDWDDEGLAVCSVHGSRTSPMPLFGTYATHVYPAEQTAYEAFRSRYRGLYSRFVDPICVGIDGREGRTVLETLILPVAQLDDYRTLLRFSADQGWQSGLGKIILPPDQEQAVASLAIRMPRKFGRAGGAWLDRFYRREPALMRLSDLLDPSPLGPSGGLSLLPGDLSRLSRGNHLWRDPRPLPITAYREALAPEKARLYLRELMAGKGARKYGRGDGYGMRLAGHREVHGAVNDQVLGLATSAEQLKAMMNSESQRGHLPDAAAWTRVRPGRLWKSAGAYRAIGAPYLLRQCRRLLASAQALRDLGVRWPLPETGWPMGDPFLPRDAACPGGGEYQERSAWIACSIHGTLENSENASPTPDSPLGRSMKAIDSVEAEISLLPQGIRTRVVIVPAVSP